jgi:cardiolipin synthase
MNRLILQAKADNADTCRAVYEGKESFVAQTREETICRYLEQNAGYPVFHDGEVSYYESGEKMFPQMLEALRKAEKYIFVEYFIIAYGKMWNEILKILLEKAEQGIKVRIIYDDFGCMMNLPPDYDKYLESLHENIIPINTLTVI